MALFTKTTKTRVSGMKGNLVVKKFFTPISQGKKKAITIKMIGEDMRTYSITLYGEEVEYLEYCVNKRWLLYPERKREGQRQRS